MTIHYLRDSIFQDWIISKVNLATRLGGCDTSPAIRVPFASQYFRGWNSTPDLTNPTFLLDSNLPLAQNSQQHRTAHRDFGFCNLLVVGSFKSFEEPFLRRKFSLCHEFIQPGTKVIHAIHHTVEIEFDA